ncbi:MAG: response regulator [Treponema sp.]|nr:response regulator [Treponema sp.]
METGVSNADASTNISLDGMKVLLVDDNDFNREIANLILTDKGIFVDEATSGKEAIEKVEHCNDDVYDLILMDIQMPEMDGYEVTKKIRSLSNKKLADIPIVAMTANAFEEDRQLSLKAGMNDHIAKPLNIQKLTAVLEKYL